MVRHLTQRELRNESGDVMRALDAGEESFVVTRNGVAVGELTPVSARRFVAAESLVNAFSTSPPVDLAALRIDLDRLVDQAQKPRA